MEGEGEVPEPVFQQGHGHAVALPSLAKTLNLGLLPHQLVTKDEAAAAGTRGGSVAV